MLLLAPARIDANGNLVTLEEQDRTSATTASRTRPSICSAS
jgi:predicted RNA polymerase sigma factor